MECHEGAKMIKTYRGRLLDGGQERIRLKTNKGDIGYRITKFQIIGGEPGEAAMLDTVKIYKVKQSTITNTIDFTDGDLLGAAFVLQSSGSSAPFDMAVIFDQEIFNQDIYVTHVDTVGANSCNYYLELEQIKLNDNESTMATLQSLRQIAER